MLILRELTFQSVMNFYEPHNQSVFQKIVEAQKNGTLSPFVGAGLSIPFGYKLWGSVLTDLASYIPEEQQKKLAFDQIHEYKYEEAAENILKEYPFMLDVLPEIVSPDILKNCPDEKKKSSAAWVIPYLFRRELVMTTNFDRVLEECYQNYQNTVIPTVTPANQDRLAQIQLNQELCLLKLHGDIGKEAVSLEDLVFTSAQYAQHYAENSPLVSVLSQRFSTRRMLFLGCSLTVDRTMQILKQVVTARKGIRHFAILGCEKSEISMRSKELEKLGILPIFYDKSNHNAVRIILERLLEETDPGGYKQLRRSYRSIDLVCEEKRPMMFDSEYFPFFGREKELSRLETFCKSEAQLLWWAVTGPGGMGKSRLVFEFCKRMREEGWSIQRFETSPSRGSTALSLEELSGWMPEATKTIVVLDDVQAYIETVCAWLVQMDRAPRSEDLRILLLERDGKSITEASWLGSGFRGKHLEEWCHDEQCLHLAPMTDDQLMAVMTNYAKVAGKKLNAELLLKTLEKVDPEFKRPLYAIAIADARCQGKDPTNWDRDKILDTLLDRELDFHLNRLQGICDRKIKITKTLQTQMDLLLADSCIKGFLFLDQIDWSLYNILQKRMSEAEMEPEEFCQRLGILQTSQIRKMRIDRHGNTIGGSVQERDAKIISLTCPDLLKEHLVLKLAFEKNKLNLLPDGWHLDVNRLNFLRKLWIGYPERLRNETAFWNQFFSAPLVADLPARLYGELLWGITSLFPELAQRAVDVLHELYKYNVNDEAIATCYATGLANLSCDQPLDEMTTTIHKLKSLHISYPGCMEVADRFAYGLVNLSSEQSAEECEETVEQLELLCHSYPDLTDIIIRYANGLFNLISVQAPEKQNTTIGKLEELYHAHSDMLEVTVGYAKGLLNLSSNQSPEDCAVTIYRLEKLYNSHPEWIQLGAEYAKALVNLAFIQTTEAAVQSILAKSQAVLQKHPDYADIQLATAMTMFNLTLVQKEDDILDTVTQIVTFLRTHPKAIHEFREALDEYLSDHTNHTLRYQPLVEL